MRRPSYLTVAIVVLVALTGAAGWFVLPAMESGVVSSIGPLWVRQPTSTPRATSTPAPWQLTATARAMPTSTPGAPTSAPATATARLAATPTPVPGQRPTITGSLGFTDRVGEGLDMLARISPADYLTVTEHVTGIRESGRNWSNSGSRVIEITASGVAIGPAYTGSLVLHEAAHLRSQLWGCTGETRALTEQAAYLRKAGEPDLAAWVESLRGTWGCP
jgi:hypothetical protein